MESDCLVYALVDPRTGEFRYVGLSTVGLERPKQHFEPRNVRKDQTYKGRWVRQVFDAGSKPDIFVLEQGFESVEVLSVAEDKWIRLLRSTGSRLTNTRQGGFGGRMSIESRRKMSAAHRGRKQSPEVIESRIAPLRGRQHSDEARTNMSIVKLGLFNPMFGTEHTEEWKRNMSERMSGEKNHRYGIPVPGGEATRFSVGHNKGGTWSEEQRLGLSGENHWTKRPGAKPMSEETRRKIGAAGKGRIPVNKGTKHDEAARAKISAAVQKHCATNGHKPVCGNCKLPGHYKTTCPNKE